MSVHVVYLRNNVLRWTLVKTSLLWVSDPKTHHCSPCKQGIRDTKGEEVTERSSWSLGNVTMRQTQEWWGYKQAMARITKSYQGQGRESLKQVCCPTHELWSFGLQNRGQTIAVSSDSYGDLFLCRHMTTKTQFPRCISWVLRQLVTSCSQLCQIKETQLRKCLYKTGLYASL